LPVLGLVFGVCATAVLLFSLVPIFIASSASPQTVLRGAGRSGGASKAQNALRSSFVVAEVALALIITAAAGALLQSLIGLQHVELGYRPDSVFVARLSLPPRQYQTPVELGRFSGAMSEALAGGPGVIAAGGTTLAPLSGALASIPFAPAQNVPTLRRDWPSATFQSISPGYLSAIGARLIAGRTIEEQDDGAAPAVAVVNRSMAEQYFEDGAVGRELLIDDNNTGPRTVTIVGVVENMREVDLDGPVKPDVLISLKQVHPDGATFVAATQFWAVRVRGDAASFGPTFVRILREVDGSVATAGLTDLRAYVDGMIAPRSFSVGLLGTFTLIALLLTTLGVYGIAAYTVEQRRREIGVRMALGATPQNIVALMLGRTLRLAGIGIAAGLAGAYLAGGLMSRVMFGVTPSSPLLLTAVSAILLSAALLASWLPGRRASRIDTLEALSAD
jgi:predicted permease